MVESNDEEVVMYVNSDTRFGSLRIDKGVNCLTYISHTDMEEWHR